MKNLLVAQRALDRVGEPLAEQPGIRILALKADGDIVLGGETVSLDDYPVHLAWLSQELLEDGSIGHFSKAVIAAPELKWMQTVSAGLDHPMFRELIERGVRLTNSDAQAPAIAEYVLSSVMYRYTNFPARVEAQEAHEWKPVAFRQIYGTTWLVVGFGNIGERVGRMARAFEAKVIGVKRRAGVHPDADEIITFDELNDRVPEADVIVIACALTEQTRDLVDAEFLRNLKRGSVLVNIARGDIVDEDALLAALDTRALDYAVLDVFREEPLPKDSPFWDHTRVHLTPHASNRGDATRPRGESLFLANLASFVDGGALKNEVELSFFEP